LLGQVALIRSRARLSQVVVVALLAGVTTAVAVASSGTTTVASGQWARASGTDLYCEAYVDSRTSKPAFDCAAWSGNVRRGDSYSAEVDEFGVEVDRWDKTGTHRQRIVTYLNPQARLQQGSSTSRLAMRAAPVASTAAARAAYTILPIAPGRFARLAATSIYCQNYLDTTGVRAFGCGPWSFAGKAQRRPGAYGVSFDDRGVTVFQVARAVRHFNNP
jgi:hypothetical protein